MTSPRPTLSEVLRGDSLTPEQMADIERHALWAARVEIRSFLESRAANAKAAEEAAVHATDNARVLFRALAKVFDGMAGKIQRQIDEMKEQER